MLAFIITRAANAAFVMLTVAFMAFMIFNARLGASSAILRVDSSARYTLFVGVTDIGPGAKTTMSMLAAGELGVPLSQVDIVWGDSDRCPYSVGESGSRTTTMTGFRMKTTTAH